MTKEKITHNKKKTGLCRRLSCLLAAGVLWLLLACPALAAAVGDESIAVKRILFISSYSFSWETVPQQIDGLTEGLGDGYIVNYEFMDTKNTTYSDGYKEFYDLLTFKLSERAPYDAVVVGDDAALLFALRYRDELFPEIPVVFEGIDNVQTALRARDSYPNITGVVEQVDYKTNLTLAKKLLPKATRLVFILDNAENGVGIQQQLDAHKDLFKGYEQEYINSSEYSQKEMCEVIAGLDENCICFYISMSQSKNGMIYTEEERYEMLSQYARIPMFRVSTAGVDRCDVLLGGYIASLRGSGVRAGQMVREALTEGDIAAIPVEMDTPAKYYFDWRSFERFGLNTRLIPGGAVIVNPSPTFLQKYYVQVIIATVGTILLLLLVLLVYFAFSRRRMANINRQLDEKNQALQDKNEELMRTSSYKSSFLSNMSHEIRTPMNGIIGMTKLAEDIVTEPVARGYLQQIDDNSQYMLGLLNDVLDMSRIDSGSFELKKDWVNARGVFESCVRMIEPFMQQKQIRFEHPALDRMSGVEFYTDGLRLKQLVINLLYNAYKFTPEGGTVALTMKNLKIEDGQGMDEMRISDTGCGMSKKFLENGLFQPFSQEHNEFSDKVRGTGLGLALVKEIVTAMGGSIRAESEPGKGATFIVQLPYRYRIAQEAPAAENRPLGAADYGLAGKHILLAEDHPLNRKIAVALLKKQGMTVTTAENGRLAVELFTTAAVGEYDAVLMDIRMPEMDGYAAASAIRALHRPDAASVPIIAMTANAYAEDVKKSYAAGMNAHLAKPVEPELLYKTLAQFIGAGGAQAVEIAQK